MEKNLITCLTMATDKGTVFGIAKNPDIDGEHIIYTMLLLKKNIRKIKEKCEKGELDGVVTRLDGKTYFVKTMRYTQNAIDVLSSILECYIDNDYDIEPKEKEVYKYLWQKPDEIEYHDFKVNVDVKE